MNRLTDFPLLIFAVSHLPAFAAMEATADRLKVRLQRDRAAIYIDRVLKGAQPAELPVEQPTKLDLVINRRTAKALGLALPRSILLRAAEVGE